MATSIETREVLAGAYTGHPARMLRHAVVVDAAGIAVAVLCKRVELENLADRYASDPTAEPTCPDCLRAIRVSLR